MLGPSLQEYICQVGPPAATLIKQSRRVRYESQQPHSGDHESSAREGGGVGGGSYEPVSQCVRVTSIWTAGEGA